MIFQYYPVGQGYFFCGKLGEGAHEKQLVIDCGSSFESAYLQDAVKRYKSANTKKHIDTLILSQLEYDRVSGLHELLEDFTCDEIILPYLDSRERLLILINHLWKYMCCPEDDRFNDFLASPHSYILKICPSVKKITYLYQNTEVTSAKELEESSIGLLPEWQSILEKFPQITFKKGNGCISLHNNWLIHLNYHLTPYFHSDAVREYVLKEYQLDIRTFEFTESQLLDTLYQEEKRKMFKNWFDRPKLNINSSGISIWLQPQGVTAIALVKSFRSLAFPALKSYIHNTETNHFGLTKNAILISGDCGIAQLFSCDFLLKKQHEVAVFQVPHHGSSTGWDAKILEGFDAGHKATALLNFGFGNTLGHPNATVLLDLLSSKMELREVSQFVGVEILYEMV